jgi:hypothetical protein
MIFDEFEMEKSVKLAADALDVMYPRWTEAINLDRLYMEDSSYCVLGQLATSLGQEEIYYEDLFSQVAEAVDDNPEVLVAFDLDATDEGYEAAYRHGGWITLREVWKKAIRERR